jgi:hypothetical protein
LSAGKLNPERFMGRVVVLLLALTAYATWRFAVRGDGLVFVTDAPMPVTFTLEAVVPAKALVIRAESRKNEHRLTVISLPRELAAQLGASAPSGFREEALPLTTEERRDSRAVAEAAAYDRETLRWTGDLVISPNEPQRIVIPATTATRIEGVISLQYETKHGLGGSVAFGRVPLSDKASPGR